MTSPLTNALKVRERDYRAAIDRLGELPIEDKQALRECVELVGCLRRLTEGRAIAELHKAFGAPGDFGYETPIGDALARVYGLVSDAQCGACEARVPAHDLYCPACMAKWGKR